MAVSVDDRGLIAVAVDFADLRAVGQASGCGVGGTVGEVPGVPVRVQEEEPLVEGLGLDGARSRLLLDACGFDIAGISCVPRPGLPVRVHDEDSTVGGHGEDGLRLPGQADCFLLFWLRARVLSVFLAGLEGVDLALLVYCQQPVIVDADAGEPGVAAGVEGGGCDLPVVPGVDPLVGSERRLPSATGRGLQVAEPIRSLGG